MSQPALDVTETTITKSVVRMRMADDAEPANATEWLEFQVTIAPLTLPADKNPPLGEPADQSLATIQAAALFRTRNAIDAEIERLRVAARQHA